MLQFNGDRKLQRWCCILMANSKRLSSYIVLKSDTYCSKTVAMHLQAKHHES